MILGIGFTRTQRSLVQLHSHIGVAATLEHLRGRAGALKDRPANKPPILAISGSFPFAGRSIHDEFGTGKTRHLPVGLRQFLRIGPGLARRRAR